MQTLVIFILHRSTKFQKNFISFMEIVIFYRFFGAESEYDNKKLRLALVFLNIFNFYCCTNAYINANATTDTCMFTIAFF